MRLGPAACFGGEVPTVTDAFNVMSGLQLGNPEASHATLNAVAAGLNVPLDSLCRTIAEQVIVKLENSIEDMWRLWENEPAYKVWEVVNKREFHLHQVIGIGAAAPAIVPMLAERMGVPHFLHRLSPVANALGATVARPTVAVELHVDTGRETYSASPGGLSGKVSKRNYQLKNAQELARTCLKEVCADRGLSDYADDAQIYSEEQFNVIRGWEQEGKLFDIGIQISPGFIHEYKGVEN
jgi:N-methylhydantoinase A/oxoprolinase/acetone carboxylase beta subunit